MKRVLALLFIGLVAWAGAQANFDDDVIDTDAIPDFDPVTTATAADFPDVNFFDDGTFADVANESLLLSMQVDDTVDWDDWEVTSEYRRNVQPNLPNLGAAGFSLSVADIVAAIQSGGSNPVEKLIIAKVVEAFNSAGVTIRGGSLVYTNNNGPYIQLSTGCSADVHLDAGWGSQAVLRPSTSISVRYGFDGLSLTIATALHADCSYNMNGHVKARIGKKVLGKCIHISKGMGIGVGADMVLDIATQLAIKPTLAWQDNTLVIKLQPTVWVGGQLVRFDPHASASFTIFGIHIRSIEAKIKQAITAEMTRQITPGRVQAELEKLQTAMQAELNRIFSAAVIPIFGMQASHPNYQNVVSAVGNINNRQFK